MTIKLISRETVAEKLAAHLHHELSLESLVAWAESAFMDGEFDPAHLPTIRDVIARIGVADVRAFGLTWEDCGAPRQTVVLPGGSSATPRRSVSALYQDFGGHQPRIPPWLHPPQLTSAERRATAAPC